MVESILNTLNSLKSAIYTLSRDVRVLVSFCMVMKIPAGSCA